MFIPKTVLYINQFVLKLKRTYRSSLLIQESHQQVLLKLQDVRHDRRYLSLELDGVASVEHVDDVVLVELLHGLVDFL